TPIGAGQLEPADVGVAAVLLGPDVRDGLVGDRRSPAADEPAAATIRVGLVRTGPEPLDGLEPGHHLEDRPDAGQVGQLGRHLNKFLDGETAAGQAPEPLLVWDDEPAGGRVRAPTDGRGAVA